ncbi:hypothetical protein LSH36_214g00016 [Paralvinella palmiformis]|uniref:Nucleotide-diphospho-sugar transferase domain-containing protein n=1 Tax=Paralvinella palmiformis TaxID=53620 RepID=A0AAD9N634_9ANNE|nr:hypothetical protein LSH36_214g00016 [Paralvinella palmiformis]
MIDASFVDMAVNYYETSIRPYGIENYLFVGASTAACNYLNRYNVACYTYTEDSDGEVESVFNSPAFLRKTNLRTEMILDALLAGITVLHTDVDVIFRMNPFPEMLLSDTDISVLWDYSTINAGFLLIRANERTVWIYDQVRKTTQTLGLNDQSALHYAVDRCSIYKYCTMTILKTSRFQNGKSYFEDGHRTFSGDNPCTNCVVIHNNYIVSKSAKIYRFKENHMWYNDENNYYSSKTNNYMTFDMSDVSTVEEQRKALINALAIGYILKRIVILPKFQCDNGARFCAMNSLFKMSEFDRYFLNQYRESTFLTHPLVPPQVYKSRTNLLYVKLRPFVKSSPMKNNIITSDYILENFSKEQSHILTLGRLQNFDLKFIDIAGQNKFMQKLEMSLHSCNYRQFC